MYVNVIISVLCLYICEYGLPEEHYKDVIGSIMNWSPNRVESLFIHIRIELRS